MVIEAMNQEWCGSVSVPSVASQRIVSMSSHGQEWEKNWGIFTILQYKDKGVFNLMFGLTKATAPNTSQHTESSSNSPVTFFCHWLLLMQTFNLLSTKAQLIGRLAASAC